LEKSRLCFLLSSCLVSTLEKKFVIFPLFSEVVFTECLTSVHLLSPTLAFSGNKGRKWLGSNQLPGRESRFPQRDQRMNNGLSSSYCNVRGFTIPCRMSLTADVAFG